MNETLTRPPKRIFIIGPMTQGVADADGIPLAAAHIPILPRRRVRCWRSWNRNFGRADARLAGQHPRKQPQ